MKEWEVVVFGFSGETRMRFTTEKAATDYAAKARRAGCLARVEERGDLLTPSSRSP